MLISGRQVRKSRRWFPHTAPEPLLAALEAVGSACLPSQLAKLRLRARICWHPAFPTAFFALPRNISMKP